MSKRGRPRETLRPIQGDFQACRYPLTDLLVRRPGERKPGGRFSPRRRRDGYRNRCSTHRTGFPSPQRRLDDFFVDAALTHTRPDPGSIVQTISDPAVTPRIAATASGIVARTDEDPFTVRNTLDVKDRGNSVPITLMGGRLNVFALDVGLPIRQSFMFPTSNTIRQTVGQYMGRNLIVLNTPRAQRSLRLLASSDDAVIHISRQEIQVQKLSGRGYYTVRRQGIAARWVCECPDFKKNPEGCVHAWAAELSLRIQTGREWATSPRADLEMPSTIPVCPNGSAHVPVRDGHRKCRKGVVQRFRCRTCGKRFIIDHGFTRIQSKPRVVVAAIDLWAKKVSYREIADHLRGVYLISVTKSTVERWVKKMRRRLADFGDACAPSVGEIWHCDETTVSVDGHFRYVWNVLDHKTRYWLSSPVSEGRTVADARIPLRDARVVASRLPQALVTDGYPGYPEAVRKELYSNKGFTLHLVIPPIRKVVKDALIDVHPGNNIIERLQGTQRGLTKVFRGFNDLSTAQEQIDGYRGYYNLVRPHAGLGGMTPADRAGVAVPPLADEGRLMAALVAAYEFEQKNA